MSLAKTMRLLLNILRAPAFLLGGGALIYEFAFYSLQPENIELLHHTQWVAALFLAAELLLSSLFHHHHRLDYLKESPLGSLTALVLFTLTLIESKGLPHQVAIQVGLLIMMGSNFIRFHRSFVDSTPSPAITLFVSYLSLIVLGSLALTLPTSVPEGHAHLDALTALFMATSATCVTGLSLVDMNTFSLQGQLIILTLIQIGGLGLLTFLSVYSLSLRKGMGIREKMVMREALNTESLGDITRLIKITLLITLTLEIGGALLLYQYWNAPHWQSGTALTEGQAFFNALFHSVSAFCNAGFSLYPDGLVGQRNNLPVNGILTFLIITGGLGFAVLINLFDFPFGKQSSLRKIPGISLLLKPPLPGSNLQPTRLSAQSRILLWGTLALLALGFCLFWTLETGNQEFTAGSRLERIFTCFFQSVTLRTAGFNTVDFSLLGPTTLLFCISLMLLGGGPGGTAGGLKISTFALMLFSVGALARGEGQVTVYKRRLSTFMLNKALVVVTVFALGYFLITGALFLTDGDRFPPLKLLFEAASAYATVGLSTGLTADLSAGGKLVLVTAMFLGRLGPLTIVLLMGRTRSSLVTYPKENVMIG